MYKSSLNTQGASLSHVSCLSRASGPALSSHLAQLQSCLSPFYTPFCFSASLLNQTPVTRVPSEVSQHQFGGFSPLSTHRSSAKTDPHSLSLVVPSQGMQRSLTPELCRCLKFSSAHDITWDKNCLNKLNTASGCREHALWCRKHMQTVRPATHPPMSRPSIKEWDHKHSLPQPAAAHWLGSNE